jgi:hypothetical protein
VAKPIPEDEKSTKPEGPDVPLLSKPRRTPLHRHRWVLFLFVAGVLALVLYFGWQIIVAWKHRVDEILAP